MIPVLLLLTAAHATEPSVAPTPAALSTSQGLAPDPAVCGDVRGCVHETKIPFVDARCGFVTDDRGVRRPVPAPAPTGRACPSLYDGCTADGVVRTDASDLEPVVIDEDGDDLTVWIHGDNAFELYVNGQHVCHDPLGFVPFNSNVVKVRAKQPVTWAVRLVDWEEHVGVGMEYAAWRVGDGGFVMRASDGTVTDDSWRCEVFYVAPVDGPECVVQGPNGRDTSGCPKEPACRKEPATCKAVHADVPEGWMQPGFDDAAWPAARAYTEERVGPKPAYTDLRAQFGEARWIWTANLDLDNHVLCRRAGGPEAR